MLTAARRLLDLWDLMPSSDDAEFWDEVLELLGDEHKSDHDAIGQTRAELADEVTADGVAMLATFTVQLLHEGGTRAAMALGAEAAYADWAPGISETAYGAAWATAALEASHTIL